MYKFGCVSFLTEVKKRNAVVGREGSNLFDTPEATNSHLAHREKHLASGHYIGHHFLFSDAISGQISKM